MDDKLVRVKWMGTNTPYIGLVRTQNRMFLNKRELLALRDELNKFIDYYEEEFEAPRIDYEDKIDWDDLDPNWMNEGGKNSGC